MFKTLLKRFVPPYKKSVVGVLFFSILSTVLSLFSFALIVPILEILFGISNPVEQAPIFEGVGNAFDFLKNYLYYYVTIFMNEYGRIQTLGFLAVGLILMTFLKVITYYLSSLFMAFMQTGVVKDLRNNILDKILTLPIGFFTEEKKGDIMSRVSVDVQDVEASIMAIISKFISK